MSGRRELRDIAVVISSIGVAAILSLLYNAMIGRKLGPGAYADFAAALALANLLAVAFGGMTPITAHLSARYWAAGDAAKIRGLVSWLTRLLLKVAAAGAVLWVLLSPSLARLMRFESVLTPIAVYAAFAALLILSISRAAVRGAQRFGRYGAGVVGEAVIRLLAGVILLAIAPSAWLAVLAYSIGMIVVAFDGMGVVRRLASRTEDVPRTDVAALVGATSLLVAAMAAFQNFDMLVVKRFFDAKDAGVYGAAVTLARWMALVAMPFEALLLPRLSYLLKRGGAVRGTIVRLVSICFGIAVVPLLVFGLWPEAIVHLVYGRAYSGAGALLLPLASAIFLLYVGYLSGQALLAVGRRGPIVAFAALFAVEAILLLVIHDSLYTVAWLIVCTRGAAAVLVSGALLLGQFGGATGSSA